jgi:hypothetical protein
LKTNSYILKQLCKKLAIFFLLAAIGLGAFATLGDGKSKNTNPEKRSLLSTKISLKPGSFSLRSGYNFRGSQVITTQDNRYIHFNTQVTYQLGHTSYIVPLKKRVVLHDKIVFNPNAATRN